MKKLQFGSLLLTVALMLFSSCNVKDEKDKEEKEGPAPLIDMKDFFKNGELLYDKIAALSPTATIILYETWAFPSAIEGYVSPPEAKADEEEAADSGKKPTKPKEFKSEAEMFGEIHTNYKLLFEQLKAKDPKRSVLYAPVGGAFAACREAHPEIALCGEDG